MRTLPRFSRERKSRSAEGTPPKFQGVRCPAYRSSKYSGLLLSVIAFLDVLKRILHGWSDERCVQILRVCREAMGENARILVLDAVVPPGNEVGPASRGRYMVRPGAGELCDGRERRHQLL